MKHTHETVTNSPIITGDRDTDSLLEDERLAQENDWEMGTDELALREMDEVQANANLIASAPEMLELLKKIAHGEVDGSSNKVFDLIAKAEGNTDYLIMAELYRQTKAEDK